MDNNFLSSYKEEIDALANVGINKVFYNSSAAHASIVLNAMVRNADRHIDIYCNNMLSDISNNKEYISLVGRFLNGNSTRTIRVLFAEYSESFNRTKIYSIFAEYPNQVELKRLPDYKILYKNKAVNFTIVDNKAFRLETNVDDRIAYGNFNDPKNAQVLSDVFNTFFNSAEEISIN